MAGESIILFLSTVHHYQDSRIFYKELFSLRKYYNNIYFLVPNESLTDFAEGGIHVIPLPKPASKFERIVTTQFRAWKKIKQLNPAIIHFHDPELIVLMFLTKRLLKLKVIFDVHENVASSFNDKFWIPRPFRKLIKFLYQILEKFLIHNFDEIIIAEKSYREIYGERALEILNYPCIKEDSEPQKNWDGIIKLAYAGGIMEVRGDIPNAEIVCPPHGKIRQPAFLLIGPFAPASLLEETLSLIDEYGLREKVTVSGRLPLTEVNDLLRNCHIGLSFMKPIENYNKSLSTKIFDYMANAMPYLVSDFEIYLPYTKNANTGLMVDYFDDDKLFFAVETLLSNIELAKEMGENGRENVLAKWNWSTQESKLLQLYNKLI